MTEDFKVSITGDIAGLKKAVGEAEKELSAFASKSRELKTAIAENTAISRGYDQAINELKKSFKSGAISQSQFKEGLNALKRDEKETTIETARLRTELINLNREQAGLAKVTPDLTRATAGFNRTSSNATNTMMEFSRVVQDAPYGIRGVANNIQQLVGNFGYLSKASGGASNAFKAMASSLMGPAGILLAVSLVTSLLVQYGDALLKSISGTEDAKVANDRLNDALREQLGLRKLLKDEIDVATRIAVAEAKLAGKNEQQQYDVKKKFSEANIAILESEYKEATKRYRSFHNKNMNLKSRGEDEITELVDESRKGQLEIQKELNDAKAQLYLDDLTEQIRVREKGLKADKEQPIRLPVEIVLASPLKGLNETEQLLKDTFGRPIPSNQFKLLDNLPIVVGEINSQIAYILDDLKDRVPKDLFGNLTSLSLEQLTQFQNKLGETEQVAYIFNDALGAGFNALGNQIASSLATGNAVLDALVSSLINSLTSIATALIQQAITEKLISAQVLATNLAKSNANGITIATSAAAAMGPAGIVALPGLLASQLALINSAFAGIAVAGAFAGGGIVGGGSYSGDRMQAYVNSGEMILNGRQQGNLFDILDGNLRRLSAPAQNAMVQVSGELRGSTILLANARAEKNNSRFYGRK